MAAFLWLAVGALLATSTWAIRYLTSGRRRVPLPPGPRGLPIIGSALDLALKESWLQFRVWADRHGPLLYFHTFGREFVIVNDINIALDLFERRSAIYCTKPRLVMAGELVGKERTSIVFCKYNTLLKDCRRIVLPWLNKQSVRKNSWPLQKASSYRLLASVLEDPEGLYHHIRRETGALFLKAIYGFDCLSTNDPNLHLSEYACTITAEAMCPGRWLVDSFPSLAYVPSWLPGAQYKHWADHARKVSERLVQEPFNLVKASVLEGSAKPSWVANMLSENPAVAGSGKEITTAMVASGTLFAAGIDTTVAVLRTFWLMMVLHPDVQRKAQAEIDTVVGTSRLPCMEDKEKLPYLNCLIKEVMRIGTVVPMMPHSLDVDDTYQGYLIPKGACVIVNMWAIYNDPTLYKDPDEFRPERHLSTPGFDAEPDPEFIGFGLGRRSCVGKHFAQTILFLNISHALSVFDIRPRRDASGLPYPPTVEWKGVHVRQPCEFSCEVTPRSVEKAALARKALATAREAGLALNTDSERPEI